jgi:hypothetical protein
MDSHHDSFSYADVEQSVENGQRSISGGVGGERSFERTRVEEPSEAAAALGGKIERVKENLRKGLDRLSHGVKTKECLEKWYFYHFCEVYSIMHDFGRHDESFV